MKKVAEFNETLDETRVHSEGNERAAAIGADPAADSPVGLHILLLSNEDNRDFDSLVGKKIRIEIYVED